MSYESWGRKSRSWTSWCTRRKRFARTRIDSKCTAKVSSFLSVSTLFNSQKFLFSRLHLIHIASIPFHFVLSFSYVLVDYLSPWDQVCLNSFIELGDKDNFLKYKITISKTMVQKPGWKMEFNDEERESIFIAMDRIYVSITNDFNKFLSS